MQSAQGSVSAFAAQATTAKVPAMAREFLVLGTRFRSGAEVVEDCNGLREDLVARLGSANRDLTRSGVAAHRAEAVKLACSVFLDESILSSAPGRTVWADHTLEQGLWGRRVGGKVFFERLRELEGESDSAELFGVLEVYCLCLLLGFKGMYVGEREDQISPIVTRLASRINTTRSALSPEGQLVVEPPIAVPIDRWARPLKLAAAACGGLAVSCYAGFSSNLVGMVREMIVRA